MKQFTTFILVLIIFHLISCNNATPLYFKRIETRNYKIDWYYFSHYTSSSPFFVEVKKNDSSIVICKSYNIIDVNIINEDSIKILFNEKPMLRGETPILMPTVFDLSVVYDTTLYIEYNRMPTFK